MKIIPLVHRLCPIEFPSRKPPRWSQSMERWYQLDAYAFAIVEAYDRWKDATQETPTQMILASPFGSNETDCSFAQTGAGSPTKFVHTLPNVRSVPLCQVMEWVGPVLCLMRDPHTQVLALQEAAEWIYSGEKQVWIWSVVPGPRMYTVHRYELGHTKTASIGVKERHRDNSDLRSDSELLAWFTNSEKRNESFSIGERFELVHLR